MVSLNELRQKSKEIKYVTVKGKVREDDYSLIEKAGLSVDTLLEASFFEVAEQIRKEYAYKGIIVNNVVKETVPKQERGEWKAPDGMPFTAKVYRFIAEHKDGATRGQIAAALAKTESERQTVDGAISTLQHQGRIQKDKGYGGKFYITENEALKELLPNGEEHEAV